VIAPLPEQQPAPAVSSPVNEDPLASSKTRALAMDLAFRLRPLTGDLPEGDLVRLVTDVALIQQGIPRSARRRS